MSPLRVALALALASCGPSARGTRVDVPITAAKPALADGAWAKFHSARFGLTLWLPDGHAWKIDDHSSADLVATHPTSTRVRLRVIQDAGELTNRDKCADKAALAKFADGRDLAEVAREEGIDKNGWDTRVFVGTTVSGGETVGHVLAFSSSVRKCLWFDFETRTSDLQELQDRLLLAHTRVVARLAIDAFGELPRERPGP